MRLTNTIRDQFVNAVMRDVPASTNKAKAHVRCLDEMYDALREHSIDPKVFEKIIELGFARRSTHWVSGLGELPCPEDVAPVLDDLVSAAAAESEKVQDVRKQVRALAYGCTTLKQLREAAPDLVKYMPTDETPKVDRTVPVVQVDIMGVLKAAGWGQ